MNKKELIKQCRYYHGEEECLNTEYSLFWDYERFWVEHLSKDKPLYDENAFDLYKSYGLKNFNSNDGTPLSLKLLLFSRYLHWYGGYGVDVDRAGFKRFYLEDYLKG